ncbi:MAG TPA: efflux RND transporter periplasmic adaptor subunit [Gemmatimonadales bacterium]|nr:efflux RND transporter periplasmic adaptor subunit [Gemmatimonadales bacterium]
MSAAARTLAGRRAGSRRRRPPAAVVHGLLAGGLALAATTACRRQQPLPVYEAVPVVRRDIIVSAQANGTIAPDTTVEVKSRAAGEVLQVYVETGQVVKRGTLLVSIDPRQPRNAVEQAQADLQVAQAQLANARSQKQRSDTLFASQAITAEEHETATLAYANAQAAVVKARVALENARIQLEDTQVRAPITGTVIEKDVERGQVIASATQNVGGGTVLLKMADLSQVQVTTPVDETDIGQIRPGQPATVHAAAFPNRSLQGEVAKIEPQATVVQNVTMFNVQVEIDNRAGLLKPGMTADVEIHIGERLDVPAIPNAALRTPRDVASAAQVLGLDPGEVQAELASADSAARGAVPPADGRVSLGGGAAPAGATADSGGVRAGRRDAAGAAAGAGSRAPRSQNGGRQRGADSGAAQGRSGRGGRYIVFAKRGGPPHAAWVRTGLTDLDYTEVLSGVSVGDSVLLLPSASLVQNQQQMRERINRVTGGGLPGVQQQAPQSRTPSQAPQGRGP